MNCQTILVVEDEVLIRMLIGDCLRAAGYEVTEAANGDEALAILRSGQHHDLLLTDVRMPGQVDGTQLIAHWQRVCPGRPVIVASGHMPREAAELADARLVKPYTHETLLTVVETLIGVPCSSKDRNRTAS